MATLTAPTEEQLCLQLAHYLRVKHPELDGLWHFDFGSGTKLSIGQAVKQKRLNQRAWPDFFLAKPSPRYGFGGLFLELKRDGSRLTKRNGEATTDHINEQADLLAKLGNAGYVAQFAVGLDEAIVMIESYLGHTDGKDTF